MNNQEAIEHLEGQWDCMCSEDCQIYTGHKDCPQGFICTDGQALLTAISALQEQDLQPNLQHTCNQLALDTISRQAAIDAAIRADMENNSNVLSEKRARVIDRHISAVQSAQPVDKDTNVPCKDTISRQEAIEALSVGKELLSRVLDEIDVVGADREKYSWGLGLIESYIKDIEELPPVQPEIIHCRDCKHSMNNENGTPWICAHPNNNAWRITPDQYCGYAERT